MTATPEQIDHYRQLAREAEQNREWPEGIVHLDLGTDKTCESCGMSADVELADGSTWCEACDGAARKMGY